VRHWDPETDGPLSEANLRAAIEAEGFAVTRYVYPPGTVFPPHSHGMDKIDGVMSGRFRLTLPDGAVVLEAGDRLFVPKGLVHAAEVVGNTPVVSLDAVRTGEGP
jgi:quercetin dioxygenase-like cupin family protein